MPPGLRPLPAALVLAAGLFLPGPAAAKPPRLAPELAEQAYQGLKDAPAGSAARAYFRRYYARSGEAKALELGCPVLALEASPSAAALELLECYQLTRKPEPAKAATAKLNTLLSGVPDGLSLSALARGYQVLEEPAYLDAARKLASASKPKGVGDGSYLQGLLDLYESDFDLRWLKKAEALAAKGPREPGPLQAVGLMRLSQFRDDQKLRERVEELLVRLSPELRAGGKPEYLPALDFALTKESQIIIAGAAEDPGTQEMLRLVRSKFLPVKIVMRVDAKTQAQLAERLPFLKGVHPLKGKPTAYVCVHYACDLPTTELSVLADLLDGKHPTD